MDNVMIDFKCTLVWNTCEGLHVDLNNRVYHSWRTGTYLCGTYSVIMRSDPLSSHLDIIGNLHHASTVNWRFSTKLSSSYLYIGVSFWYASNS
jgi:hypothetical protein